MPCLPISARAANTWKWFQSGAQTINRCGSLSLSTGSDSSRQIHKHISGASLHHCGFHVHNRATTMSWQAGASRLFTPQHFSLWFGRLISSAGPPLPVCLSARLSAQVTAVNITGVRGERRVEGCLTSAALATMRERLRGGYCCSVWERVSDMKQVRNAGLSTNRDLFRTVSHPAVSRGNGGAEQNLVSY